MKWVKYCLKNGIIKNKTGENKNEMGLNWPKVKMKWFEN